MQIYVPVSCINLWLLTIIFANFMLDNANLSGSTKCSPVDVTHVSIFPPFFVTQVTAMQVFYAGSRYISLHGPIKLNLLSPPQSERTRTYDTHASPNTRDAHNAYNGEKGLQKTPFSHHIVKRGDSQRT